MVVNRSKIMGARGGGGGRGGRGGGGAGRVSSATLATATQSAVSGFSKGQKAQYNFLVSQGYKPAVAAANVSMFPNTNFKNIAKSGGLTSKSRLNKLSNTKLLGQLSN